MSNPDSLPPTSPTKHRPATIAELDQEAQRPLWDPSRGLKHWIRIADKARNAAKELHNSHDYESAFVEYVRAATIVIERLPSLNEYHTLLNKTHQHNLRQNGQDLLYNISILKPLLVQRYEDWCVTVGTPSEPRKATKEKREHRQQAKNPKKTGHAHEATQRSQNRRPDAHDGQQFERRVSGDSNLLPTDLTRGKTSKGVRQFERDHTARRQQGADAPTKVPRRDVMYGTGFTPPARLDKSKFRPEEKVQRFMPIPATMGKHEDDTFVNEVGPVVDTKADGDLVIGHNNLNCAQPAFGYFPPLSTPNCAKSVKMFMESRPTNGFLSAESARKIFARTGLTRGQIAQIWILTDKEHRGQLDVAGFIVAMYLVQAVSSKQLLRIPSRLPPAIYHKASSYASTFSAPLQDHNTSSSSTTIPSPTPAISPVCSVTPHPWVRVIEESKQATNALFEGWDTSQLGYLNQGVVHNHFMQCGLTEETFQRIWNLSDVNNDGKLNRDEFAVAFLLLRRRETGMTLPKQLPESVVNLLHQSHSSSSTGDNMQPQSINLRNRIPLQPAPTRNLQRSASASLLTTTTTLPDYESIMNPTPVRHSRPSPGLTSPRRSLHSRPISMIVGSSAIAQLLRRLDAPLPPIPLDWDISPTQKAESDTFFDILDPWKTGYVEEDIAAEFFQRSKLPFETLMQIWDLADVDADDRLSKEEFSVAMYLIKDKLAGRGVPSTLPPSLIPPSARRAIDTDLVAAVEDLAVVPRYSEELPRPDAPPPPYRHVVLCEPEPSDPSVTSGGAVALAVLAGFLRLKTSLRLASIALRPLMSRFPII